MWKYGFIFLRFDRNLLTHIWSVFIIFMGGDIIGVKNEMSMLKYSCSSLASASGKDTRSSWFCHKDLIVVFFILIIEMIVFFPAICHWSYALIFISLFVLWTKYKEDHMVTFVFSCLKWWRGENTPKDYSSLHTLFLFLFLRNVISVSAVLKMSFAFF